MQEVSGNIQNTKEQEERKLKEEAESHKRRVEEIKENNQRLKVEIQNALEKNK